MFSTFGFCSFVNTPYEPHNAEPIPRFRRLSLRRSCRLSGCHLRAAVFPAVIDVICDPPGLSAPGSCIYGFRRSCAGEDSNLAWRRLSAFSLVCTESPTRYNVFRSVTAHIKPDSCSQACFNPFSSYIKTKYLLSLSRLQELLRLSNSFCSSPLFSHCSCNTWICFTAFFCSVWTWCHFPAFLFSSFYNVCWN